MVKDIIEVADCEYLLSCPFITERMTGRPATLEMYKNAYCHCNSSRCARYIVTSALGRAAVPADLLPNQVERAKDIIAKASGKYGR